MTTATIDRTKARGIPFRDELVPLIMSGRKTQTRRILSQPNRKDGAKLIPELLADIGPGHAGPYGGEGAILYVKEALYLPEGAPWTYRADNRQVFIPLDEPERCEQAGEWFANWNAGKKTRYRSTRFMPKWAARTFLEVLAIRVEQVQEIHEADAIAEGFEPGEFTAIAQFRAVWEKIHGPGSWERNDWVWAYAFRRLDS